MFTIRATYIPKDDMYFDKKYYVTYHLPLAKKLLSGHVNYIKLYAEFDTRVMMNEDELRSPGVFVLLVKSKTDVDNFNEFRRSDDVKPQPRKSDKIFGRNTKVSVKYQDGSIVKDIK